MGNRDCAEDCQDSILQAGPNGEFTYVNEGRYLVLGANINAVDYAYIVQAINLTAGE
jgi:hypothetical protein